MPVKNDPYRPKRSSSPRNKYVAALLSLFFGCVGVNRFYLGQISFGVISILFCWTFIPAIIGVIDFFIFLLMSDKAFNKKYNTHYCIDCDESLDGICNSDMYCGDCLEDALDKKNKDEYASGIFDDYVDTDEGIVYLDTSKPYDKKKSKSKKLKSESAAKSDTLEDVLKEMDQLIGLESVKEEVKTLINFVQVQKERKNAGLKTHGLSYHLVFTGNPGTGKTTVARIISRIYKHLGILSEGHLVETDRSGLIAQYQGQTPVKVNHVIDQALNGILFIDEAYALNFGNSNETYGKEAVATLIKRMEDDRDSLVVILAGYTNEMKVFLDTNPGFESRINRYINFPDYTPDELMSIFELQCKNADYILDNDAKEKAMQLFISNFNSRDNNFGNGRFVRNIFENSIENQSNRIAKQSSMDKKILTIITVDDILVSA